MSRAGWETLSARRMARLIPRILLLVWLLSWPASGQQRATPWREFRKADGLADPFCTLLTVNPREVVLVRHSNGGLSRIDGYTVTNLPPPAGDYPVHEDRFGQLWSLHKDGLQTLADGQWTVHPLADVRAELQTNLLRRLRTSVLLPIMRDRVLVLLSDKLVLYEAERRRVTLLRRSEEMSIGRFNEIVASRSGGLIIAGNRGVAKIPGPLAEVRPASLWEEFTLPEWGRALTLQRPQEGDDGTIAVLAESEGDASRRILLLKDQEWRALPEMREAARMAWPGPDNTVWFFAQTGLFRIDLAEPSVVVPIEAPESRLMDAATAPNGTIWFATPEGVFRHAPPLWRVPPRVESRRLATHAVVTTRQGAVWFVQTSGLLRFDARGWKPFPFEGGSRGFLPREGDRDDLWAAPNGDVLLDVEGRTALLDAATGKIEPIAGPDGNPFRLLGGRPTGETFVYTGSIATGDGRIEVFDGARFTVPPYAHPPVRIGPVLTVYAARSGDVWVGGASGVAVWTEGQWRLPDPAHSPDKGTCFGETFEGRVWCGAGDRLWETDGREWRVLRTGLEQVQCILRAGNGIMWVGSSRGLYRIKDGFALQHGADEGLPGDVVYSLAEGPDGTLWAGTQRGLACHRPTQDEDPPVTSIVSKPLDRSTAGGSSLEAVVQGQDRWSFTPSARLLFSHRINEQNWSDYAPETVISLLNLSPGEHRLEVRAMDRNGNVDPSPASFSFLVVVPWSEDPRLLVIAALAVGGIGFFAVLAWNRHRRLVHSYAEVEQLVALRTEQLARANDQLLHSQKMNALGTLAAGVAHDFNNILSIIKGSAQIIQKNPSDTIKIRTRADRLVMVADQGAEIVRALLGFSRNSERDLVRCSLNEVVQDTLKLFGEGFLKQVQVEFEPAPGLEEIVCSKSQIQQMLLNIILNASDAMNGSGRLIIRVDVSHAPLADPVLAPVAARTYMTISIRDFGIGIPPEVLPRIFEPFFTTKSLSQRRGTGLGLSMVYRMAVENGFGLSVESVLNEGSTFGIIVPVPETPEPAPEPAG